LAEQVLSTVRLLTEIEGGVVYITPEKRSEDEVAEFARRLASQKETIELRVLAK
jgi:hypothetical protein